MTTKDRNKRIAKNTFYLYARTLLTIVITLYTTRVITSVLGLEDYGFYGIVCGVTLMLSFLNSSLSTATQRFLNYEIGLGEKGNVKEFFSTSITCNVIIALLLVIITETVGLWLVKNLTIPVDRMNAAIWVYHFSIIIMVITIMTTPFDSLIIAHEKLNVYAYISIIDVILKLIIAFIINYISGDKLFLYGLFLFLETVLVRVICVIYCKIKFYEVTFALSLNKNHAKKLLNFSGWMIMGTLSNNLAGPGVNMLINNFFNPVYNSAFSVATQVQTGVYKLVDNMIMATKPQIIKSYSQKDFSYMYKLVFISSKLTFFLLYIIVLPVILQANYLLSLWLKEVPEYTGIFVQLLLIEMLIVSSMTSVASVSQASGKIRNYQLIISICFFSIFCFTALFFKLGFPVYSTFIITVIFAVISFFAKLCEINISSKFPIKKFLSQVISRLLLVAILSAILPVLLMIFTEGSIIRLVTLTFLCLISSVTISWFVGLNKFEKDFFMQKIKVFFRKKI